MDIHGGNLNYIANRYNIDKNEIIDFSNNINPIGTSPTIKKNINNIYNLLNTYPDEIYFDLRKAIASYTKVSMDNIIVGNGATELISILIKTIKPRNSLIILPTYSEYEKELNKINSNITHFDVSEKTNFKLNINELINNITNDTDLLVFCNPNNPTGYLTKSVDVEKILTHCKNTNTMVLLDETYVEFSKENFGATELVKSFDNLFIVRGTSKFFAISGLRLGYGITSNISTLTSIKKNLIPWNVNIVAEYIGSLIFTDKEYIQNSITLCNQEYIKYQKFFKNIEDIKIFESDTNFILFKIITPNFNSNDIFEYMIKNKILIRNLSNSKGLSNKYFRICIQKPNDNDLFLNYFNKFLSLYN